MSAKQASPLSADLRRTVAELQRQLDERTAELEARTIERDEAIEQQAAATEMLQVINGACGDLAPVFDAMLEKAMRLCEAAFGGLWTFEGDRYIAVALRGVPAAYAEFLAETSVLPGPGTAPYRFLRGERLVHNFDLKAEEPYRSGDLQRRALVDLGGARSALQVPLRKEEAVLGVITVYRQEVRPFSDKHIALLQHFAAQAVIAMENARLLTETREALEQQTATAEVLRVINSSPSDLAPVFDAILEKAHSLCGADRGALVTFDREMFRAAAIRGLPLSFAGFMRSGFPLLPGSPAEPLFRGEHVHIPDFLSLAPASLPETARSMNELAGTRTLLMVPLHKDDRLLGFIAAYRTEVRPFSEKQIALLQNFAAQAVIAIENARLLTELRQRTGDLEESLEYQTATSDVLQVISRSTFDLDAILHTVVSTAHRLCGADYAVIFRNEGGEYRFASGYGNSPEYEERERKAVIRPGRGTIIGWAALEGRPVQIEDALTDPEYEAKDDARVNGARAMLGVPLLREGQVIGALGLARGRVEAFSDREVELVTTFADQAAIAIENARLITETREALEQQTATAEVLGVINSSPGDLVPVFDAILEKAHSLCGAVQGAMFLFDGEHFRAVATRGMPEAFNSRLRAGFRGSDVPWTQPLLAGEPFSHIMDIALVEHPIARAAVELARARTILVVALRKDNVLLGQIVAARREVRPFTDKQIALLQNFAAQAVIAMENARLITETREALEQQTATAEVLQVINSSPGDLAPVFDAILEKAHSLCAATHGSLTLYDGERFRAVATYGHSEAWAERLREGLPAIDNPGTEPLLDGAPFVHVADMAEIDHRLARAAAEATGVRTALFVPLCKDNRLIGVISAHRREVRPFSDKQIALLQNFAAQAVIAMDNARLLGEIRQRQAELRVTFDNMGDGVAMFDTELRLAAWNRNFQQLLDLPDDFLAVRPRFAEYFRYLAERGEYAPDLEAELRSAVDDAERETRFERARPDGRVIEVRRNPVPGGRGFVLMYSDITERKRAEAEIRVARAAAEKTLAELRATQQQMIVQQKMAALGQLTAGIAHEIKNPLNFVNNFANLSSELLDELKDVAAPALAVLDADKRAEIAETLDMLDGNLARIAEHGRRADGIVKSMLQHSRGGSGDWQRVDLNALLDEAVNLAYHGARAQDQNFNITLERDLDRAIEPIEVVPQDVMRVFLNLIGNGFYAATMRKREADAAFRPALTVTTRDRSDAVEIRIRDNGIGIPPEHRERLFQPFFTTKPTGEGTGLGLSISYDIVTQQHGGTITVDSQIGAFAEFTVCLPRREHPGTAERAA